MQRFSLFLSLVLLSFNAQAASNLQDQALALQLEQQELWLRLLHFNAGESYVDDDKFFLAEDGKTDPQAELLATITKLVDTPEIQCQFPARYTWLSQQLPDLQAASPVFNCGEYLEWRERIQAHSVALVLATSFLNSPSSMYGHTFIRFDPKDMEQGQSLTSYAVNFGARDRRGKRRHSLYL